MFRTLLIALVIFGCSDKLLLAQESVYLSKGLELKKQGKYSEALTTWEQARAILNKPSLVIGREHIKLVTEQKIDGANQIASDMYFWGLSTDSANTDQIKKEMELLEPIVDPDEYKQWKRAFKNEPSSALALIEQFWVFQDITPDTPYNERLIEHWERIGYARKNFTRRNDTIYGTDDRGIGYVQFGEPNLIHTGELEVRHTTVQDLSMKKIDTAFPRCFVDRICKRRAETYSRNMANAAFEHSGSLREYEIWVYTTHNISPVYNNVLFFGDTAIKGFAKATSVNDFIPSAAATFSKRFAVQAVGDEYDFDMNPAVFIQHEYLQQLAGIDPQFGQAFSNLIFQFFRAGEPPRKEETFRYKREQEQTAIQIENAAPDEVSIYEEEFPDIPVTVYNYRFLDDENIPFSIVYLESRPQGVFILDSARNSEVMLADNESKSILSFYNFTHGLQIRAKDQRLLASQELYPGIDIDTELESPPSISIFQVPYVSPETWQVFYAQLKNTHLDSEPEAESPFPNELRGIGTIKQQQGKSLSTDLSELVLSDVIMGYNLDTTDDGTTLLPFDAAHDKNIPEGESVAIHYELYHLKQDPSGVARFEIDIEIIKKQRGLNRLGKNDPNFTLTLNQQSDQSYFRENLEIDTSTLKEGSYVLSMKVTDSITKQVLNRSIDFDVKKN